MTKRIAPLGILLFAAAVASCVTRPPIKATHAPAPVEAAAPTQPATAAPTTEHAVAVLRVDAGALVTQVNGDAKLRCAHPDCRLPLPAGTHKITVTYKDTETRAGSTVTYASMHPRVIEVTLEPGHMYRLTASGRLSRNWWIAVEDYTANKTVYNDREKLP